MKMLEMGIRRAAMAVGIFGLIGILGCQRQDRGVQDEGMSDAAEERMDAAAIAVRTTGGPGVDGPVIQNHQLDSTEDAMDEIGDAAESGMDNAEDAADAIADETEEAADELTR